MNHDGLVVRGLKHAGWSSADYLVLPLLWFLTTPFFVRALGEDLYGIWMLVNALIAFSSLLGLGMSDAAVRFISRSAPPGDKETVSVMVRSIGTVYLIVGVVTAGLTYALAPLLVTMPFRVAPVLVGEATTAVRVGSVIAAARLLDTLFVSVLQGFERFDLMAKVRGPFQVLTMLLNVVIVLNGGGVDAVLAATFIVLLLSLMTKVVMVRSRLLPGLSLRLSISRSVLRRVMPFSFNSWVQGLGSLLSGQVDRLLVASIAGSTALTYYAVCVSLAQQIHALLSHSFAFLLPMTSGKVLEDDKSVLRRIFFNAMNGVTLIALGLGIPLFLAANQLLTLWIDSSFAVEATGLLEVFVVVFVLLSTSIVPHYMMNATALYPLNTLLGLANGAVIALSTFVLIPVAGIAGAAFARLFGLPVSLIGRAAVHRRLLGDHRRMGPFVIFVPIISIFGFLYLIEAPSLIMVASPWILFAVIGISTAIGVFASWRFLRRYNTIPPAAGSGVGSVDESMS
ncbi:MAG: oligosaccharide flippase family protein [Ignavibacteria bacterium]|nr:oligosaccharide flippase family protein [Ignavibacteria bacterium]